jgi:site-specific recombinase XerD
MLIRRTEVDGKTFRAIARDTADNRFRQAATCARVPKHLRHTHTLRHTRATLALAEGMAEEDVKFLLGHSRIETTRGYLGVAKSLRLRLQTRAEQVTGLFG